MLFFYYGAFGIGSDVEQSLNWEGGYNYTINFIFDNPIETIRIFLRTIYYEYEHYYYSAFGVYLSGFTLRVPHILINTMVIILIASVFYGKKDEWQPTILQRSIYLTISAIVFGLCMVSMFLGWTSDTRDIIIGVQGRYFIPILPLLLIIFKCSKIQIPYRVYCNILVTGFLLLQGLIVKHILNYTIGLYT